MKQVKRDSPTGLLSKGAREAVRGAFDSLVHELRLGTPYMTEEEAGAIVEALAIELDASVPSDPLLAALGRIRAAAESDADLQRLPGLRNFLLEETAVERRKKRPATKQVVWLCPECFQPSEAGPTRPDEEDRPCDCATYLRPYVVASDQDGCFTLSGRDRERLCEAAGAMAQKATDPDSGEFWRRVRGFAESIIRVAEMGDGWEVAEGNRIAEADHPPRQGGPRTQRGAGVGTDPAPTRSGASSAQVAPASTRANSSGIAAFQGWLNQGVWSHA